MTRGAEQSESSIGTFVGPDEFCRLLLSRRNLVRLHQPQPGMRGLLDPDTGKTFVIQEEILDRHLARRRRRSADSPLDPS
jgi:hypothetical protein